MVCIRWALPNKLLSLAALQLSRIGCASSWECGLRSRLKIGFRELFWLMRPTGYHTKHKKCQKGTKGHQPWYTGSIQRTTQTEIKKRTERSKIELVKIVENEFGNPQGMLFVQHNSVSCSWRCCAALKWWELVTFWYFPHPILRKWAELTRF